MNKKILPHVTGEHLTLGATSRKAFPNYLRCKVAGGVVFIWQLKYS
jgi:hypothetical protein